MDVALRKVAALEFVGDEPQKNVNVVIAVALFSERRFRQRGVKEFTVAHRVELKVLVAAAPECVRAATQRSPNCAAIVA